MKITIEGARRQDGTVKEYTYNTRSRIGTKTVVSVERGPDYKLRKENLG